MMKSIQKKLIIRRSLHNLFCIPTQFIQELQEDLFSSIQTPSSTCSKNSFPAADTFLVKELLHPAITSLNMERIPTIFRNFIIHNVKKMSRLSVLKLCLSMTMSWSSLFSDIQTERFCRGMSSLKILFSYLLFLARR